MEGRLRLITGNKGAAKTLWTVDQLFKEFERNPDRGYYSDITALKHTGVKTAPDDWREIPDNSLIVYDEVQFKLLFSRHNSKRDTQILELTTMRKRGVEMWIITQRARFLNADVLGLVDEHVQLERNGKKTSKVFIFNEAEVNITKTKKMFAFDKYVYAHPQHLYGFYESIKDGAKHGTKSYFNKGVVSTVITLVIALIALIIFLKNSASEGMTIKTTSSTELEKKSESNPFQQQTEKKDLSQFCSAAINIDKIECKNWFNEISKNNTSVNNVENQSITYDSNKPYQYKAISNVQPTSFPRISGVIRLSNGKYSAVDQQGNYMPEISQSDCKRWLSGYRPHDYFANNGSQLNQNTNKTLDQEQQKQSERSAHDNTTFASSPFSL